MKELAELMDDLGLTMPDVPWMPHYQFNSDIPEIPASERAEMLDRIAGLQAENAFLRQQLFEARSAISRSMV
jgi:hypothetical protein